MATHASAEKRARQNEKKRLRNRANTSEMKTAVKKVFDAIEKKDSTNVQALFIEAESMIAKTRRKGSLHKNTMARKISRLASHVNKFKASI